MTLYAYPALYGMHLRPPSYRIYNDNGYQISLLLIGLKLVKCWLIRKSMKCLYLLELYIELLSKIPQDNDILVPFLIHAQLRFSPLPNKHKVLNQVKQNHHHHCFHK